ncbi:hypothetical protein FRB99_000973 [Tulasnella sp. 403]|nr:hypothetical protein FRB99_000973 [Tulasnella sp. 403]
MSSPSESNIPYVRLGKSGLKVSKLILGCMSYGKKDWQGWVLDEEEVHKMQNYARQHNLTEFVSMQNFHNAVYREEEREMVPLLQDLGVGMIPWSPLARGFLTHRYTEPTLRSEKDPWMGVLSDTEKLRSDDFKFILTINDKVAEVAEKRGVSMAQVALAWSLSKPFVTAPIVGTTSVDKLKDLVAGLNLKLTEEEIKSIDELYRPRPIAGHM